MASFSPILARKLEPVSAVPPPVEVGYACDPWSRWPFQSPRLALGSTLLPPLEPSTDDIALGADGVVGGKVLGPSGIRFSLGC